MKILIVILVSLNSILQFHATCETNMVAKNIHSEGRKFHLKDSYQVCGGLPHGYLPEHTGQAVAFNEKYYEHENAGTFIAIVANKRIYKHHK